MDPIAQKLIRRKQSTPDPVRFIIAVFNNAHALRKWQLKMEAGMQNYVDKVNKSIQQIFDEGSKMIVASNLPNKNRLMKKLVIENDRCDTALRLRCSEMGSLVSQVMNSATDNAGLKRKVLALLHTMRRPELPNIAFIFRAVGKKYPNLRGTISPSNK
jgi:hypothetical protein